MTHCAHLNQEAWSRIEGARKHMLDALMELNLMRAAVPLEVVRDTDDMRLLRLLKNAQTLTTIAVETLTEAQVYGGPKR